MMEEARAEERHEHADRRRAQARYNCTALLHTGTMHGIPPDLPDSTTRTLWEA